MPKTTSTERSKRSLVNGSKNLTWETFTATTVEAPVPALSIAATINSMSWSTQHENQAKKMESAEEH